MEDRPSKRQHAIHARLGKLDEAFRVSKDHYYRHALQQLQSKLSTIHQGTNEQLQETIKDVEEARDYELVELALWEKFQIQRAEFEFESDIRKANDEHDEMVKLVKEKLYANLERQIKQLKEDKVLLDMANSHSYSMESTLHDLHKNTRSTTKELGYLSDRRSGLRRRNDYTSNAEDSVNDSGNNSSTRRRKKQINHQYQSSNDETDTGADLSSILFAPKNEKVNTRHSSKSYAAPPGLKNEEVNDDLLLLRRLKK